MVGIRELFITLGVDFDAKSLADSLDKVERAKKMMLAWKPTQLKESIKQLAPAIIQNTEKIKDLEKQIKSLESATPEGKGKEAKAAQDAHKAKVTALKAELEALRKITQDAKDDHDAAIKAYGEVKAKALRYASAAGAIAYAMHAFAASFAAGSEALRVTSRDLGATTDELQRFRFAADQAGIGASVMDAAMRTLRQQVLAVTRWGGSGTYTTRLLGVSMRDASGHVKSTGQLMGELGVALSHVQSPYRRARIAAQLFGEEQARLLRPLLTNRDAMRGYFEDFEQLGGGISAESVEAGRQYTNQLGRMRTAYDSLRSVVATGLLPVLSYFTGKVAELTGWMARMTRNSSIVQAVLVALGAVGTAIARQLIVAWFPVIAPFLPIAAAIGVVLLILDDLITMFRGGRSVIGDFIDALGGAGTAAQWVQDMRDGFGYIAGYAAEIARYVAEAYSYIAGPSATSNPRYTTQRGVTNTPRNAASAPRRAATARNTETALAASDAASRVATVLRPAVATLPVTHQGATNQVVHDRRQNIFNITGETNPQAVAQRVQEYLASAQRDHRGGSNPRDPHGGT